MDFIKKYWLGITSLFVITFEGFVCAGLLGTYYLAKAAVTALTGSLIFLFAASRLRKQWGRSKLEFWCFGLAVVFAMTTTSNIFQSYDKVKQLNNSKRELARLTKGFAESDFSLELDREYTQKEYGEFSKILIVLNDSLKTSERMTLEINESCEALEDLLDPEKLLEFGNIIQAKECVAAFSEKLDRIEKEYNEEMAQMRSKITQAFTNEKQRQSALASFEKTNKETSVLMDEYFSIQKGVAATIDEMLNLLSEKVGTFYVMEDSFVFEEDEDADTLNQFVEKLEVLIGKEEKVTDKIEAYQQELLKYFE